jgi:hypothetical protein
MPSKVCADGVAGQRSQTRFRRAPGLHKLTFGGRDEQDIAQFAAGQSRVFAARASIK